MCSLHFLFDFFRNFYYNIYRKNEKGRGIMKKYRVRLIKYETYEVYGENENDAYEKACLLCDEDANAWTSPVDDFDGYEVE